MPYLCALVVNDRLALNCPLEFRHQADARALSAVLEQYFGARSALVTCTSSTIAQPFNLREFSAWFSNLRLHAYHSLEDHYRRNLMMLQRPFPDEYRAPYNPPAPSPALPVLPDNAPPLINYEWQDQQLDREDFHAYLAQGDLATPAMVNTWWFHTRLDRSDFEEYLTLTGQEEWEAENQLEQQDDATDEEWMINEDSDLDSDDEVFSRRLEEEDRDFVNSREYDTSSDLYDIYSRAHDFDEWD
ncbi:hypothetical protein [Deinococcus ficus]|uniref:hypothetical protein n=1 Tax=Deinococcus ficus TaxID=317577 RepID=UPI00174C20EF|nr:hypothetical protein [Deinococcus ficus]GHF79883.1 hypothetical protein GCM10017782_17250 [Deinococcus ficus]